MFKKYHVFSEERAFPCNIWCCLGYWTESQHVTNLYAWILMKILRLAYLSTLSIHLLFIQSVSFHQSIYSPWSEKGQCRPSNLLSVVESCLIYEAFLFCPNGSFLQGFPSWIKKGQDVVLYHCRMLEVEGSREVSLKQRGGRTILFNTTVNWIMN